ncbi:MAG: ankyrin repeat domain-containing protein [Acidobacteriota bacterium]
MASQRSGNSFNPREAFLDAAAVPLEGGHATGTLDAANAILAMHPEVAASSVHAAAVLGDAATVRQLLQADPSQATVTAAPRGWDALTHLCFSRYLRVDETRADGFLRAAELLLDAGADAKTGWFSNDHGSPAFESALYGAAGIAHRAELTRLLVARGADVNDGEVVYHTPETCDNAALQALVESGRLTEDSLASMLLRKCDWHDLDGVRYLLSRGANPNYTTRWGYTAVHQAVRRDNELAIVQLLLDHGGDPTLVAHGRAAVANAARRGRADLLTLFGASKVHALTGVDRLLAA